MIIRLPEEKTYLPGAGRCIYCWPSKVTTTELTREHIIARKFGGKLILHTACCPTCQGTINQEIENPSLRMWKDMRAHLKLPTSSPLDSLRIGRTASGGEVDDQGRLGQVEWDTVAIESHPVWLVLMTLPEPEILGYTSTMPRHATQDCFFNISEEAKDRMDRGGFVLETSVNSSVFRRFIAKVAHGAAVAELGTDTFEPFLSDIILGKDRKNESRLIGMARRRGTVKRALHEITIRLAGHLIVVDVQLFASFGFRPYQAVVGRLPRVDL